MLCELVCLIDSMQCDFEVRILYVKVVEYQCWGVLHFYFVLWFD